jgi:predicted nucleotidyltransferase
MKIDREHVLQVLRSKRAEIEERYGLRMVGLVGSVARGEAGAGSDIDIIVDVTGRPTLFSLSRAEWDLAEAVGLGLPVEIVLREGMRSSGRELIERDLVPL